MWTTFFIFPMDTSLVTQELANNSDENKKYFVLRHNSLSSGSAEVAKPVAIEREEQRSLF